MSEREGPRRSPEEWDRVYREAKPGDLDWDLGGPDPELVRLVDEGKIDAGRSIDLGCGPAHDAVFLRSRGFNVTAIDIAPAAIEMARSNARKVGVEGIEWRVGDVLGIADPHGTYTFANDQGCFHGLAPEDRARYAAVLRRVLLPGMNLLLRVRSDQDPPGPGPFRVGIGDIKACFVPLFALMEFRENIRYPGTGRLMNVCLLRKI